MNGDGGTWARKQPLKSVHKAATCGMDCLRVGGPFRRCGAPGYVLTL